MIIDITRILHNYNFFSFFDPDNCSKYYVYQGGIETKKYKTIEINLYFDKNIITFPRAVITKNSSVFFQPYHCPHISETSLGLDICYHDNSIIFDTTNIESMIQFVLRSIKEVLDSIKKDDMSEIIPEFKSYWCSSETYFSRFSNEIPEYIHKNGVWLLQSKSSNYDSIPVFTLQKIPTIANCTWPITTFDNLDEWIKDIAITQQIKKKIICNLKDCKQTTSFVFHVTNNNLFFGLTFLYFDPILTTSKRLHLSTVNHLFNNHKIKRFWIEDVDEQKLIMSNAKSSFPNLSNYNIAIIGGGTIGSNLICNLVRLGAGSSTEHELSIIDNDEYMPENYSRHILPFKSFGKNKATEIANYIKENNPDINIKPFTRSITQYKLERFNIVIDVTGEENITDYINKKVRNTQGEIILLICWIRTDGSVVECLIIPNKASACHECFKYTKYYIGKSIPQDFPRRNSCSSVYIPFPVMTSQYAALLVNRVLLDYITHKITSTTYYKQNIEIGTIEITNIDKRKDCNVCSKN